MPGKNKNPLLGWHPPAELSAWARAEAERRGVPLSAVLTEALDNYRSARIVRHLKTRHGYVTLDEMHPVSGNALALIQRQCGCSIECVEGAL